MLLFCSAQPHRPIQGFTPREGSIWTERRRWSWVPWNGVPPQVNAPLRIYSGAGRPALLSVEGLPLGVLNAPLNPDRRGLLKVSVMAESNKVLLSYLGPGTFG